MAPAHGNRGGRLLIPTIISSISHLYIHTYVRTYIHTDRQTYIHTYLYIYIYVCMSYIPFISHPSTSHLYPDVYFPQVCCWISPCPNFQVDPKTMISPATTAADQLPLTDRGRLACRLLATRPKWKRPGQVT